MKENALFQWSETDTPEWASVWPLAAGVKYREPGCLNYTSPVLCIHLLSKGKLYHQLPGQEVETINPGDIFLNWPKQTFSYWADAPEAAIELWWIRITGSKSVEFCQAMGLNKSSIISQAKQPAETKAIMKNVLGHIKRNRLEDRALATAELYRLLNTVEQAKVKSPSSQNLAHRVKSFMEENLSACENIDTLSRIFRVSRHTLFLHFKAQFGQSPIKALIQCRIDKAKTLLASTDYPVAQVALACGYQDEKHFFRQFKCYVGTSPDKYRRQ